MGKTSFDRGAAIIRAQLRTMPSLPGVYRMLGIEGTPLYVGKAKNLKKRVTAYTQQNRLPVRIQRMVARTVSMEIVVTRTEAEALLLEANLIQHFAPPYNILFRDDKSYPYIYLSGDHPFPRLAKHRGARSAKGWYFGPFASAAAVDETLIVLQRGFMIRNCSDSYFAARTRPCLQYHIKRCTGPCAHKVTEAAYAAQVAEARAFLSGESGAIQERLAKAMQEASDALDFEQAARLRDRIKVLTSVQARQDIQVSGLGDADIVAAHQEAGRTALQLFFFRADRNFGTRSCFPSQEGAADPGEIIGAFLSHFYASQPIPPLILVSHLPPDAALLADALSEAAGHKVRMAVPKLGDKKRLLDHALANASQALGRKLAEAAEQKKLLQGVAKIFDLASPPNRIEVYDNAHTSGQYAVGGMIAAGPEGFLKKTYRTFNIRDNATGDDFAMMTEVLTRRFARLVKEDPDKKSGLWPDLLLIDGGAGQLGRVQKVLADLGVTDVAVVGIAKGPDRNAGRERFFLPGRAPFSLPPDDPILYYLQRLRDEAHRYANGTHGARRTRAIDDSGLDAIAGIGPSRKKALLRHFGSAKGVEAAGIEDLMRVKGISRLAAKKIYDYFHVRG